MSLSDTVQELSAALKRQRRETAGVDHVHGMLTAAICGPKVIKPAHWLPVVFPKTRDLRTLLRSADMERIITLLLDIHNDLLFTIRQATFTPYLGADGSGATLKQARPWCQGFMYGMSLHGSEWLESEDERLAQMTAPIFFIADPAGARKAVGKEQAARLAAMEKDMVEAIRWNVPPIYDYWNLGRKVEEKRDLLPEDAKA